MSDDRKWVIQKPILMRDRANPKPPSIQTAHLQDINVPVPPDGCESQQVMDFAVIRASCAAGPMDGFTTRLVEVYAERWSIPVEWF